MCYNYDTIFILSTYNPIGVLYTMKKPHFFKKIILSMNSKAFYNTILHEHFMKSLLFLILFSLLISLPFSIYKSTLTGNKIVAIAAAFPDFSLQNGEFKLLSGEPFVYNDQKELLIIADTTSTHSFNDLVGYELGYLFGAKSVILSQAGLPPQTIKYADIPFFSATSSDLDLLVLMKPFLIIMSTFFTLLLALIFNLFISLFSSSMAFFIKNGLGLPISFSQAYKVAIYSMTAPLVFVELLNFIPSIVIRNLSFGIFVFINLIHLVQILSYMKNHPTDISV